MNWLLFIYWPLIKYATNTPKFLQRFNIKNVDTEKVTNNIVSSIHSLGSILLNVLYFFTKSNSVSSLSCLYSYSYFVYDGYLIAIKKNIENYPYLLHHLAALIILEDINDNYNKDLLIYLYLMAEISNIPNYLIYHSIKCYPNQDLKNYKLLQVLWFSFFRVVMYTLYARECYEKIDHKLTKFNLFFIYFAGAYWTFGQFKGVYTSYMKKIK